MSSLVCLPYQNFSRYRLGYRIVLFRYSSWYFLFRFLVGKIPSELALMTRLSKFWFRHIADHACCTKYLTSLFVFSKFVSILSESEASLQWIYGGYARGNLRDGRLPWSRCEHIRGLCKAKWGGDMQILLLLWLLLLLEKERARDNNALLNLKCVYI